MAPKHQPYERHVLPNGVRLLLIPMDGVASIATSVMVGVGSRYETPAINGVSHFLEHMVFKGTEKYPTTDDVNVVERQGGLQNAYTDIDITNFHNKVLASDWELGLDVNKELAIAPRLESEFVDRERDVILEEMKRYEDEPAAKVEEAFHAMMYPSTHLGMRIIGEEASLRASNARTLTEYHARWYRPDRLVVVVAGRMTDTDRKRMIKKTQEWFGTEKGSAGNEIERVHPHQEAPKVTVVTKREAQQAHLELGIRTFDRHHADRYAWNVFNLLMGVSFTSRLFREIREKRGLCYHIRSSSSNWVDTGYWSIYAGVATEKVYEAVTSIMAELAKVREEGVTDDEVAVAKKRLKTILAFKSEDPEFINEYYGRQEIFGEPIQTLSEYLTKIQAVTTEEINRLVRKYIIQKTLNLALVWNKPSDEALTKMLRL